MLLTALLLPLLFENELAIVSTAYASCIAGPIALPIVNTSLSPSGSNRGVTLGIGTPAQYFALDASFEYNNTFIWPTSSGCPNDVPHAVCVAGRGGSFQSDSSSTFKPMANLMAAGGSVNDNQAALLPNFSSWATESFVLNPETTIQRMPWGMLQPLADTLSSVMSGGAWYNNGVATFGTTLSAGFQGVVGLGSNSSLLNELISSEQLGSHVWSYFYGSADASGHDQVDGTLVLGGYDAGRIRGPNATFPIVVNYTDPNFELGTSSVLCLPNQPFLTITDLVITQTLADGRTNTTSLFGGSQEPLHACIDLHFEGTMLMPDPMWTTFRTITGIERVYGDYTNVSKVFELAWIEQYNGFNGSMEVTLGDNLKIQLDNSVLVQPTKYFDQTGNLMLNTSRPKTYVNQQGYYGSLALLGRNFFSSAYIMFNPTQQEMTVWQANSTSQHQQQLVPVDDGGQIMQSCPPSEKNEGKEAGGENTGIHGLSTGAIAGVVIGCIALAASVVLLVFCMLRRRRNQAGIVKL